MKSLVLFLCFILFCGDVHSQSVQENVNTRYSPWSITAFSLVSREFDQADQGGLLNSYNFVGPNYRINNNERIALKMAFNANSNGYDRFNGECYQGQDASFADPFLEYAQFNLGLVPELFDIYWSGRVYFPVSKPSRDQQTIGRYRSSAIFTRWVSQRLVFEFRNDLNYFHQSSTTYTGTHTDDACQTADNTVASNTKKYNMQNWLSFWYLVHYRLSVGMSLILEDQEYNLTRGFETSRQRNGRMREITASLGPSLRYNYDYNLSFILSLRDVVEYSGFRPERQDSFGQLGQFRASNTELSLLSFLRF